MPFRADDDGASALVACADDPSLINDAFAYIDSVHRARLTAHFRRSFADVNVCEDLVQRTFMKIFNARASFHTEGALTPYLYRAADRLKIDYLREKNGGRLKIDSLLQQNGTHHREVCNLSALQDKDDDSRGFDIEQLGVSVPTDEELLLQEASAQVQTIMAELTEEVRQTVELIFFQGMKYREAAEALHIPIGTVKSRVRHIRDIMKQGLRHLAT